MKDSGAEWLGQMPEHWDVTKLRRLLHPVVRRGRPDLPLLSVVRDRGVIVRDISNREENRNYVPEDLSNYKVVRSGQFAMNKMKAWQGSYGISRQDGVVSPAYFVFHLEGVEGDFFHRAVRSKAYVPYFFQASDGVRIGQWDLSPQRMREIPFAVPPNPEQDAIVRFIDYVDRRIRRYIRAKRKLIKLLEEQKQAIIHQAVTGQIDVRTGKPYPAYKSSGVERLGQVPEHWEVRRLKTLFRESDSRSTSGTETLLSLRMHEGLVPHEEVSDRPVQQSELVGYKRVAPGQLVMNRMRAAIGIFGVPTRHGLVSPDYAVFECDDDLELLYFLRLFKTSTMCAEFRLASKGLGTGSSGFMRLYTDQFGTIWVPFPPQNEQAAIVEFLDQATSHLNEAITRANREIDLLNEYRTRLIADVVTGKLDVREAAASLPDESAEPEEADDLLSEIDEGDEQDLHDDQEVN